MEQIRKVFLVFLKKPKKKGFSLIELLVVVGITGILIVRFSADPP